jgi:hypothetical protein
MESSCLRGYLQVKRRRVWVKRFVVVEDGLLTYYKTASDLQPRGILNIAHCKLSEGEKHDGKLTMELSASFTLKLEFPDKPTFDLWRSVMMTPRVPLRSVDVLSTELCHCAAEAKTKLIRSIRHLTEVAIEDMKPHLKTQIKQMATLNYTLKQGQANSQVFLGPPEPSESLEPRRLVIAAVVLGLLACTVVSLDLLHYALICLMLLYFKHGEEGEVLRKVPKTHFKAVTVIQASIGEIYRVLNDTQARVLWEPHCRSNDSVTPGMFTLRYSSSKGELIQELVRTNAGDETHMYCIETAGCTVKQAFLLEDFNSNCTTQTKVVHYGSTAGDSDPLQGNTAALSCLKTYIESLYLSKPEGVVQSIKTISEVPSDDEEASEVVVTKDFSDLPEAERALALKLNEDISPVLKDVQRYLAMTSGWEPIKLSSDVVTGWRRQAAGGLYVIKGEGQLNISSVRILELLKDLSRKTEYDEMFEAGNTIITISSDMEVVYQRFKKQFPASGRDFCILQRRFNLGTGQVIAVATSTTHPSCPAVKGLVRATLHMGAFVLEAKGENSTKVTYLTYVDLGGSVPGSIANMVQKKQPLVIEAIGRALARSP